MTTTLFICPWPPDPRGGGGGRRSYQTFRALIDLGHVVHVLVVDPAGGLARVPHETLARAASVAIACDKPRLRDQVRAVLTHTAVRRLSSARELLAAHPIERSAATLRAAHDLVPVPPGGIDRVHVTRLGAAPYAFPFIASHPHARATLDIDDVESTIHTRFEALHRARGDVRDARQSAMQAQWSARREAAWLPRFERVYACSSHDVAALRTRFPGLDVARLPNTYDPPALAARSRPERARTPGERVRLLFVGSLGYLPNDDALRFFARDVLPRLPAHVDVHVVGHGLADATRALLPAERTVVHGHVADLAPHYADADVVIVPLRGGGGTRIKIIEAFAHRRPVVATTLGAEGLAVGDQRDLLIADDAPAFAAACMRIAGDDALARRLVDSAHALYLSRYAPSLLPALIA